VPNAREVITMSGNPLPRFPLAFLLPLLVLAAFPGSASATFHLMQIEQVIGGVDGSATTQAIQLRMRSFGQNLVSQSSLYARDATGANPVLLIDITTNVANNASGSRVLIATADFSSKTSPYLAAGSLTFEDDFGTVYWRLSWGGGSYTGTGSGAFTNDLDEDFNPPFGSPLPSGSAQALLIQIASTALSTNNASDYAVTSGAAIFTNNAGVSGIVQSLVDVEDDSSPGLLRLTTPVPNPARAGVQFGLVLPRDGRARVALYEASGREVALVADREFTAGRHELRWNGPGTLTSGVYFLELRVDRERRVRRLVVLP
jgi:hypothetical protein